MKLYKQIFLSVLILNSCSNSEESVSSNSNKNKKQELLSHISRLERKGIESKKGIQKIDRDSLISSLNNFYYAFPKDDKTPYCLDKLQMIYSSQENYEKSSEYLQVIIKNFPNYINRPLNIESQASNYDIFIQPRDTSKVRFYYNLLLKENPDLEEEKRSYIIKRLENNHLSFNNYIQFLNEVL